MAFWGVEVKPGKRVLSSTNGKRLRITQASLGIGNAAEKTIVQCRVGRKNRPIILCALVPYIAESCCLELEFDEAHDMIFSVIGPRSIHLTGYFVHDNRPFLLDSDVEPYGFSIEDIEGDSYHSEDDEYEGSFIDDNELPVPAPSPIFSHQGKKNTKELRSKRLKKKLDVEFNQSDELNESKDEDTGNQGCEPKENKDVVEASLCQQQERDTKIGDQKEIPQQMESQEVVDGDAKDRELENGESKDAMVFRDSVKNSNIIGEDGTHTAHITCTHIQPNDSTNVFVWSDKDQSLEEMMVITDSVKNKVVIGEDGTQLSQNMSDHIQANESKNVDANTVHDSLPMDTQSKKRTLEKKKTPEHKKSKPEVEGSSSTNVCNAIQNEGKVVVYEPNEEKTVVYKQDDVTEKQCEAHSLSNGLIIEELTKRDPNGKLALRGRKVKIHYTGMLKETGVVVETSVGKNPCKFRLGDEKIIDGCNMGIDGMRLGDKRRLIIPPSLGFGEQGFGTSVPPNSWLVYEIELVGVQRRRDKSIVSKYKH